MSVVPTPTRAGVSRRSLLLGSAALTSTTVIDLAGAPAVQAARRRLDGVFSLGVASGDPSYDGVVLWTRLALDPLAADGHGGMPGRRLPVHWQVATDPRMRRVVRRGTVVARPRSAHAVHVEVTGLRPGAEYFYRFRVGHELSAVGRTTTTPVPGSFGRPLTMCFASCSNYAAGYFTAYRRLAEEEPDLVLHLGDYIYEGAGGATRAHAPAREVTTLAGYRVRHAQYRTDPDLQAAHAIAPWSVVWDDHEVENNYADDIPSPANQPGFLQRRAAAYRAYYEHMPLRRSSIPSGPDLRLFRRVHWGDLATFHMLDTRQYRDDQACDDVASDCPDAHDPTRTITGGEQERWLLRGLAGSRSTWDLLGQQVFFAVRDLAAGPAVKYSMDAWDGYVASRQRVLTGMVDREVANPVILTGDVHKHYANNVALGPADPASRIVATELVATSVTSGGDGQDVPPDAAVQLAENPHIKLVNAQRGYVRTRIDRTELTADFRVVPYVSRPGAPVTTRASFVVEAGRPGLNPV